MQFLVKEVESKKVLACIDTINGRLEISRFILGNRIKDEDDAFLVRCAAFLAADKAAVSLETCCGLMVEKLM